MIKPGYRQGLVETESFLITGKKLLKGGDPDNRQEKVVTESFLIDGHKWYGGDLVTDKKWL